MHTRTEQPCLIIGYGDRAQHVFERLNVHTKCELLLLAQNDTVISRYGELGNFVLTVARGDKKVETFPANTLIYVPGEEITSYLKANEATNEEGNGLEWVYVNSHGGQFIPELINGCRNAAVIVTETIAPIRSFARALNIAAIIAARGIRCWVMTEYPVIHTPEVQTRLQIMHPGVHVEPEATAVAVYLLESEKQIQVEWRNAAIPDLIFEQRVDCVIRVAEVEQHPYPKSNEDAEKLKRFFPPRLKPGMPLTTVPGIYCLETPDIEEQIQWLEIWSGSDSLIPCSTEDGRDSIPTIDPARCQLCLNCVRICPHQAATIRADKERASCGLMYESSAFIVPTMCQGCERCVTACPAQAITSARKQCQEKLPALFYGAGSFFAGQPNSCCTSNRMLRIAIYCCENSGKIALREMLRQELNCGKPDGTVGSEESVVRFEIHWLECIGSVNRIQLLENIRLGACACLFFSCKTDACRHQGESLAKPQFLSTLEEEIARIMQQKPLFEYHQLAPMEWKCLRNNLQTIAEHFIKQQGVNYDHS